MHLEVCIKERMVRLQAGGDRFVCGINLRRFILVREGRAVSSVAVSVVNLKLGSAGMLSVMMWGN